jgi:hypothetical protein
MLRIRYKKLSILVTQFYKHSEIAKLFVIIIHQDLVNSCQFRSVIKIIKLNMHNFTIIYSKLQE